MIDNIFINGKQYTYISYEIGNMPIIIIKCDNGYVANSYLDIDVADKVGDIAAIATDVHSLDELIKSKVFKATSWAKDLGIKEGTSIKRALELMCPE